MDFSRKRILQTLIYSDLFNFPLTQKELWVFLKSDQSIKKKNFDAALHTLMDTISYRGGYFCLKGREAIIERRERIKKINNEKYLFAKKVASILAKVPTVQFIGLSGSVAAYNADKTDDIDLFIIVKRNTLWVSRFTLLVLLQFLGIRRKKNTVEEQDTVCINMMLDEGSLKFPKDRQDIYTAHEIMQLRPLLNRNNTHIRFLQANKWTRLYMPNVLYKKETIQESRKYNLFKKTYMNSMNIFVNICNQIVKVLQIAYIKRTQTTELVSDTFLAFHPFDYRKSVLSSYNKKLRSYRF